MLGYKQSGRQLLAISRMRILLRASPAALFVIFGAVFFILIGCVTHSAVFSNASAQAITRGYGTDDSDLRPGMVVALAGDSKDTLIKVERASLDNQDKIIGVATTVSDSLVTVGSSQAQVFIENEGNVPAYVSDVNGTIKKGDLLTISPLKGILMKAGETSKVVAISQEDFVSSKASSYKVTGGNNGSVLIEELRVNLDSKGGNQQLGSQNNTLSRIGQSLTGRQVSDLRVIIALVVFFIVMLSEGAILYGSISSAVKSLGRNPLAGKMIRREMLRVAGIAFVVLLVGLAAVYAMLWV